MKKKNKISIILIILLITILAFSNIAFASITEKIHPLDPSNQTIKNAMNIIIGVFQVAAAGVGVIMLTVLGIKYVASSPNEKAEIKKHATVYIVGACMAFGASGLVTILQQFVKELI